MAGSLRACHKIPFGKLQQETNIATCRLMERHMAYCSILNRPTEKYRPEANV